MAVSTFAQDCSNTNPLVRALAVRSMCRIKLVSVVEHLILPLKNALSDKDAYVRKTAAFGVAKLYEIVPESIENAGLLLELRDLVNDTNPMVVANSLQALFEVNQMRSSPTFSISPDNIDSILNALHSSNEWCQPVLFDVVSNYESKDKRECQKLVDRLVPFLRHSNPAIVVGSFRNIYRFMDSGGLNSADLLEKIIPPYITLVTTSDPEIQFIVLRTLSLFVLKYPVALSKEIRIFFCKFNDRSYVKMQKLDIIVTICSPSTCQMVLDEFQEYTNEVDFQFVRKTIRCIGQIAMKIPASNKRCVDILVSLVNQKASYAVEESIRVVCDLLRKFPNQFDSVIAIVCEKLDIVKLPEARSSAIWILGEYSQKILNVEILIDPFLDSFHDENPLVQLQVLTAMVKIYLTKPDEVKDQLQYILTEATKLSVSPDVRNRATQYWRLLSENSETAKNVLLFNKDGVEDTGLSFDPSVLDSMIGSMGSLSGVLHLSAKQFLYRKVYQLDQEDIVSQGNWIPCLSDQTNLEIFVAFHLGKLSIRFRNNYFESLKNFALAIDKNSFGVSVSGSPEYPTLLDPNDTIDFSVPIQYNAALKKDDNSLQLKFAIRVNEGIVYATCEQPISTLVLPNEINVSQFELSFSEISTPAHWINF